MAWVDIVVVKSLVPMLLMKLKNIWPPFKRLVNKTYAMPLFMPNERIANRVAHEERLAGMEHYCCCYWLLMVTNYTGQVLVIVVCV